MPLEKEVKTYIINKEHGKGVDWYKLKNLKEKSINEGTNDFQIMYEAVLSKAGELKILCSPQANTFFCLVDEIHHYPSVPDGERYNIKDIRELQNYINVFFKDRWVTPVMQLKL